jgi:uncharacterized protein (TIGR02466 family)
MIVDLFKVPIYNTHLNINNHKLETYCLDLSKRDSGRELSNSGGWQSTNLQQDSRLDELISEISTHSNIFFQELGLKMEAGLINIWVNINKYRDYNHQHIHPNSKISGVYYVTTPENSGDLLLFHPAYDLMGYDWICEKSSSEYVIPSKNVKVKSGVLILFPSWLKHSVESNMNLTKKRISISFNLA